LDQSSFHVAEGVACCLLHWFGHKREGTKDVSKFIFGQTVQMGDQAVELGAQACTFDWVGGAVAVVAEAY
jgi:hypothetical protein